MARRYPSVPPAPHVADSPCVRNCCLDESDVCLGCGRTLQEIQGWHSADAQERARIRLRAAQRCQERAMRRLK